MADKEILWMYDRENVMEICVNHINSGRHFRMCGPRKVGKTTILVNLKNRINERKVVYYNCLVRDNTPWDIINGLFRKIDLIPEANEENWEAIGNQLIDYLEDKNPGCVLIIDEFSTSLSNMEEHIREMFLNWFVSILESRKKIIFGIAGSISLESVLRGYKYSAKFNTQLLPIVVWPFDEENARGYIKEILNQKGVNIREDALKFFQDGIINNFGRDTLFPLFLRSFIEYCIEKEFVSLIERVNEGLSEITEILPFVKKMYETAIGDIVEALKLQKTYPPHFIEWSGYINYIEDDLKKSIGMGTKITQEISSLFMKERVTPGFITALRNPGINATLRALEDNYLVKVYSDGTYHFYIKFLREVWIKLYPLDIDLDRV